MFVIDSGYEVFLVGSFKWFKKRCQYFLKSLIISLSRKDWEIENEVMGSVAVVQCNFGISYFYLSTHSGTIGNVSSLREYHTMLCFIIWSYADLLLNTIQERFSNYLSDPLNYEEYFTVFNIVYYLLQGLKYLCTNRSSNE